MNYVVVDFEWNQACYGKGSENRKIPFEIIEIGAVKLDENLKEIDRFSRTIRPKVYKKLHYITRDLTGITQEELCASDPFSYVLVDFMLWCGKDYIFCTWGNMDLVELQRNMKYYGLLDLLKGPVKYYNVQKFFRLLCAHDASAVSLESAVDYFQLPKEAGFHRGSMMRLIRQMFSAGLIRKKRRSSTRLIIIRIRRVKGMRSIFDMIPITSIFPEFLIREKKHWRTGKCVQQNVISADVQQGRKCIGFRQERKRTIVWPIARNMVIYAAN